MNMHISKKLPLSLVTLVHDTHNQTMCLRSHQIHLLIVHIQMYSMQCQYVVVHRSTEDIDLVAHRSTDDINFRNHMNCHQYYPQLPLSVGPCLSESGRCERKTHGPTSRGGGP